MDYPVIYRIKQRFDEYKIVNIEQAVQKELEVLKERNAIKPGMNIAVTCGSRGIANISLIIKTTIDYLKDLGARPFVIPAMGSHGGATAEGQTMVLEKLGVTPETMGVPVVSCMDVVKIGETPESVPIYMDKNAYNADGIIVINRVKPHTDFKGNIESGLLKMLAVGLGKHKGCSTIHANGLEDTIPKVARAILEKAHVIFGLAILENSKDETYKLKGLFPQDFEREERLLLKEAKSIVPKLPWDYLDILVVQEMGKTFSGTGMDTKVIGRIRVFGEEEMEKPCINKIVVLDLSDNSYGNALGVGLADITTKTLVDKIDFDVTYANTIPTTYLERGKIPVIMKDDREAIKTAMMTIGNVPLDRLKLAIIPNTLHLEEIYATKAAIEALKDKDKISVLDEGHPLNFDESGSLIVNWRR
ncbi:conserved protein of unknown function [Tepidanaerobacter acetatoxydans Re1]|uniref:LarA-like N-terminal domain-containing protein n=1 Tax=Tepidanaerobacter acetatoxydans (strain DSM 21804 / JCM 16047 / Re1) TaxID=1209989 RepID=F4LS83_TEPAE|nr:lactate racemase domain-containing protein [Tepidanaerobacter acetatoxydans]AEE90346.1 hypothetical protein TepRe1_0137 [Tepidanaerobacter acetatoxydans Re1]CCP24836.1 conserved protein of unknown function [Tepidanaerobacter acetatoxydans Re1]